MIYRVHLGRHRFAYVPEYFVCVFAFHLLMCPFLLWTRPGAVQNQIAKLYRLRDAIGTRRVAETKECMWTFQKVCMRNCHFAKMCSCHQFQKAVGYTLYFISFATDGVPWIDKINETFTTMSGELILRTIHSHTAYTNYCFVALSNSFTLVVNLIKTLTMEPKAFWSQNYLT